MGLRYLDSASGAEASPYESPTSAAHALATLNALALAINETMWVNSTHSESPASAQTFTSPAAATPKAPQRLLCVSDFDASPGTLATGAAVKTSSGAYNISFVGAWHCHGLTIAPGDGGTTGADILLGSTAKASTMTFDACTFKLCNASASEIWISENAGLSVDESRFVLNGCTVNFGNASNKIYLNSPGIYISDLKLSGTAPTTLFHTTAGAAFIALVENSDLSGVNWTNLLNVFTGAGYGTSGTLRLRNCKLPASWNAYTGTWSAHGIEIYIDNCNSASGNHVMQRHTYAGSVYADTSIYATTGPANDGTTSFSWRMVSRNTSIFQPLYSEWINVWVDDTSTSITPSVEILVSGDGAAALTDADVWLECDAMTTSGYPIATRRSDRVAQVIDSGSDQAAGTTAWTGDGYTTERTHKLAVASFTPTIKGYIRCRVALAKDAATIYVNPRVALS